MFVSPAGEHRGQTVIPARVSAAQQYLQFAEQVRSAQAAFIMPGDCPKDSGRELTKKEQVVYDAALDVLRAYFTGEVNYGDSEPQPNYPPDDNDPKERIPVNQ